MNIIMVMFTTFKTFVRLDNRKHSFRAPSPVRVYFHIKSDTGVTFDILLAKERKEPARGWLEVDTLVWTCRQILGYGSEKLAFAHGGTIIESLPFVVSVRCSPIVSLNRHILERRCQRRPPSLRFISFRLEVRR